MQTFSILGDLGRFVGGFGTLVGVLVAWYAGSKALPKWRQQRFEEKRADIAAEALVAVLRFCSGIQHLTNPLDRRPERPPGTQLDAAGEFLEMVSRRMNDIRADVQAFLDAWPHVTVYLDDEAEALFKELWDLRASILVGAEMYADYLREPPGFRQHDPGMRESDHFYIRNERIDAMRSHGIEVLRRVARHANTTRNPRGVSPSTARQESRDRLPRVG